MYNVICDYLLEYIKKPPKRCGYECHFYIANYSYVNSFETTKPPYCGLDAGNVVTGKNCKLDNYIFTKRLLEIV